MLDRQPPSDVEAEQALVGSAIIDSRVIGELVGLITEADFYDQSLATIWGHLARMAKEGQRYDRVRFRNRLQAANDWDRSGGEATLRSCTNSVVSAANAAHYAEIVRRKADLRRLIEAGTDLVKQAFNEADAVESLLNAHERRVFAIRSRAEVAAMRTLPDVAEAVVAEVESSVRTGRATGGVATGLSEVDTVLGALSPGEMLILAARPGVGKTSFALQWARHVARQQGHVLFASLEMRDRELVQRALCGTAGVSASAVRRGQATAEDAAQLRESLPLMQQAVTILSGKRPTVGGLAAFARRVQSHHGLSMIVVDYIGKLSPDNFRAPRHEQVTQISGDLKEMAMELTVPLIVLCQLKREDDTPTLSSLRESSSIEQDADVVAFIYADKETAGAKKAGRFGVPSSVAADPEDGLPMSFTIAKHRHGSVGRVVLRWYPTRTEFHSNSF